MVETFTSPDSFITSWSAVGCGWRLACGMPRGGHAVTQGAAGWGFGPWDPRGRLNVVGWVFLVPEKHHSGNKKHVARMLWSTMVNWYLWIYFKSMYLAIM